MDLHVDYDLFIRLAVTLGVGLLVGLQREQERGAGDEPLPHLTGGVRTFPMVAMSGAVAVLLSQEVGPWIIGVVLLVLTVPLTIAYYRDLQQERERRMASAVAFVLTYLLGVLAMIPPRGSGLWSHLLVVASVGIIITFLLSMKRPLHSMAHKVSSEDVYTTLRFLIVAVIVLPLLPDQDYGPFKVLNPFQIGLMVVLIAGIGFVGYLAIRILGPNRGIGLTALIGGLVSSTAVALAFSARAREVPGERPACAMAVVLASSIMFVRILIEVSVVHAPLVQVLFVPVGAMLGVGMLCTLVLWRRSSLEVPAERQSVEFRNPVEMGTAIKFGLIFAVVLWLSKAASHYLGSSGIYLAGILAGITDVDAITLSMARLAREGLSLEEASTTILLGAAANTLVKSGLAIFLGGWIFGRWVLMAFVAVLAAGFLGLFVEHYLGVMNGIQVVPL